VVGGDDAVHRYGTRVVRHEAVVDEVAPEFRIREVLASDLVQHNRHGLLALLRIRCITRCCTRLRRETGDVGGGIASSADKAVGCGEFVGARSKGCV
jgi:hypothetical protein